MSAVDFLVPPSPLPPKQAKEAGSLKAMEALAFHGLLEAADWVREKVQTRPYQKDYVSTELHGLSQPAALVSRLQPSPEEMERARQGQEWDDGPGAHERLVLWATSQQALSPLSQASLLTLAVEKHWRFALKHLLSLQPELVGEQFRDLFSLARKEKWVGGMVLLGQANLASTNRTHQSAWELARAWAAQTNSLEDAEGLLQLLPEEQRLDPSLWAHFLAKWRQDLLSFPEVESTEALVQETRKRFSRELERQPSEAVAQLLNQCHLVLVMQAPSAHVKINAKRYFYHLQAQGLQDVPAFAATLVRTSTQKKTVPVLLDMGRRSMILSQLLEQHELGDASSRRAEQLRLHMLAEVTTALAQAQTPFRSERLPKRLLRLEQEVQKRGFTELERGEALSSLTSFKAPHWPEFYKQAWSLAQDQASQSQEAWEQWNLPRESQPSLMVKMAQGWMAETELLTQMNGLDWLSSIEQQVDACLPIDLTVGKVLVEALQRMPCSPSDTPGIEYAWKDPESRSHIWRFEMVSTLAFLDQHGMLDLRSTTLAPTGLLEPIYPQLHQRYLEQTLTSKVAHRPKIRM